MTGVCLAASQKTCVWEFGVTPYLQNCSSVWSSEHMHSVSGRREPAGWQKNTIGIAHVLVLTMSQAALPDGEFEWSQLWVIKKNLRFCASFLMVVIAWMLLFHGEQNQPAVLKSSLKFLIWEEAIYSEHMISQCPRTVCSDGCSSALLNM